MVTPLLGDDSEVIFFEDKTIMKKFSSIYGATKAAQIHIKNLANETKSTGHGSYFQPNPMPTALRGRFYQGKSKRLQSIDLEAKRLVSLLDM